MTNNKYGIMDLPTNIRKYIWKEATTRARWQSLIEIGEGSNMLIEWAFSNYSTDEWIKYTESECQVKMPEKLKAQLSMFEGI